jgi:hypothetical protein
VVFSGQLVATLLSLLVVPSVYRVVKGWELARLGSPRPDHSPRPDR